MKRLLWIPLLFLCSTLWAAEPVQLAKMNPYIAGAVASAGIAADSCTSNLLISWHAETTTVTETDSPQTVPAGCSVGDTTAAAASGAELSETQKKTGAKSVYAPTANDYYGFSVSSEDIVKHAAGTVDFWVYVKTAVESDYFFQATGDADNQIYLLLKDLAEDQFRLVHVSGTTARTATSTVSGGVQVDTWYHIIAKWDETAHGANYLSLCVDTTAGTGGCGYATSALGTWAGTLSALRFGAYVSYIDDIKVYGTWQ